MLWSKAVGAGGAGGVVEGWNVSTAVFLQDFSFAAQEANPQGLFFNPDGLKMYVIGFSGADVNEYNLSTAWDVSTAVFNQSFSVVDEEFLPTSVFFKPDGLKMYIIGISGDDVNEYNLSTAWNVSTAVFLQRFSIATQETNPQGLFFKPDGTKMYIIGDTGDDVTEYNLSTEWNVFTAAFFQNKSVAAQETEPRGLFFKPDGLKMYIIGRNGDDVNEYNLSTAWNISTAVFLQNFSVAVKESVPHGLFFKPDGTKMYVMGLLGDTVYEYDLTA